MKHSLICCIGNGFILLSSLSLASMKVKGKPLLLFIFHVPIFFLLAKKNKMKILKKALKESSWIEAVEAAHTVILPSKESFSAWFIDDFLMLLVLVSGSDQEDFEKWLLFYLEGYLWGALVFFSLKRKIVFILPTSWFFYLVLVFLSEIFFHLSFFSYNFAHQNTSTLMVWKLPITCGLLPRKLWLMESYILH